MKRAALLSACLFFGSCLFLNALGLTEGHSMTDDGADRSSREKTDTPVTPGQDIRKVKSGFSIVRYEGDYGFDSFLNRGGADSDGGVLSFLTGSLLAGAEGLDFGNSVFGCSTLSVAATEGGYLFGRNFDWQKSDIMVVTAYPDNGYSSVSTVNLDFIRQKARALFPLIPDRVLTIASLYAPLDGMNEKGLCVAVNMIEDYESIDQNTEKPDITTTTAVRLLLDKASNVEEAVELLESYDFHASFGYMVHLAIADAEGNSVALEYVHNRMRVVNTPILTNFYLAEGDKLGIGSAQSHQRYEILEDLLQKSPRMDADDLATVLSRVSKKNFEEFLSTEWSVVFDQNKRTARYYHRENYKQSYSFKLLRKPEA